MTNNHRELVARAMYSRWSGNDPHIHVNRMATWDELSHEQRKQWLLAADAAIKAHLAALGLDEVRRGIIENGLNILATNSNGMTQTEWNDFSNAILAMLKASGEEHAG